MLRCLKYTSLNSKLLVIYFANFVELGGYCPKTGYFIILSLIPNSCHKTLINVTFERGSEKVTFFPWFWYMILPTTNNELGNKTRKKEKMGVYYPGWRYALIVRSFLEQRLTSPAIDIVSTIKKMNTSVITVNGYFRLRVILKNI